MDSKLVVEQMSGSWKIKHPDMKPLAMEANRLAPFGTTYTWVPREQNKHADRLANEALDGKRNGVTVAGRRAGARRRAEAESLAEEAEAESCDRGWRPRRPGRPRWSWSGTASPPHTAREALLRRPRERQPRAQRRGPRPDPRHRRLAGAAGRAASTRWSPRPYAAPASPREILAERARARRSRSSRASPRWSSAPGTG